MQIRAARGEGIEWHFAEYEAGEGARELFRQNGISGIRVIHTPAKIGGTLV
jgi:hypothetical protein